MLTSRSLSLTRPAQLLVAALAALALALTSFAATASAVPGPNQTQLSLDPLLTAGLKVAKISLAPKGSATIGSAGLYFPVTNTTGVTDAFVGTTKHQGGFELIAGKKALFGLRNIIVTTKAGVAGGPVTGTVTAQPVLFGIPFGINIPISTITVDSVAVRSPGVVAKYKLRFDAGIVRLINAAIGTKLLTPGQPWASVETRIARPPAPVATPTPAPVPVATPAPVPTVS